MPTPTRAVLWDMDGVMVLSGDLHYESWTHILCDYQLSMSREDFERTFGMNNRNLLRAIFDGRLTPQQIQEVGDRKEAEYRRLIVGHIAALPGVREWLARLEAASWRQVVASSAPMANVAAVLSELDLWLPFDAVLSGGRLPASKPDPALFLAAAAAVGVEPARCVIIEDATVGVEAARRAGIKCIAVTTTHPAESLQAADVVVDRLDHLSPDTFDCLVH
jgi:beta-phosphoglucomutase